MKTTATCLSPGLYQYTYPTFVDSPQYLCIHFLTPDGQQAFVSYPHHSRCKTAQLVEVSWFKSVKLVQLDGQPQLMKFIRFLVTDLSIESGLDSLLMKAAREEFNDYVFREQLAA